MNSNLAEKSRRLPKRLGFIVWILLLLSSISVGRAINSQNDNLLDLRKYALLQERSPFQDRLLMAPVLRAAGDSPRFRRFYDQLFSKTVRSPEDLAVSLVNCLCLLALLPVIVALRRSFTPPAPTTWLAPILALHVIAFTYVVHYEQRFTMPYDMPSLLLFTLGILAVVEGRGWLLMLILSVAVPNRETAVFLVPIWFWLRWREGRRVAAIVYAAAGTAMFLAWRIEIGHLLSRGSQSYIFPWRTNLASLLLPLHWPQVASAFGFLAVPMWMLRSQIRDLKLRRVWVATIPFLLSAIIVGIWKESRIFGELSGLVGVTFALELEHVLAKQNQTVLAAADAKASSTGNYSL